MQPRRLFVASCIAILATASAISSRRLSKTPWFLILMIVAS